MLQSFKNISWVFLLAAGLQASSAFSLLGPSGNGGDAWQVEAIAYNPIPDNSGAPPFFIDTLVAGPKNIGEEYRRNTPVMYYACDANFLNFFGSAGSAALDQAFTILDNSLTNVDFYSPALTEFPLNSGAVNFQASALGLLDLKSETMALMTEQLGLADSVRYVWALHNRFQPPGTTCPDQTTYQVILRNLDITASPLNQLQYSPYVNGSLYTYSIIEICNSAAQPPMADAYEIPVDPLTINPPVASLNEEGLQLGSFFTGLTRDDVAGLRYLLTTNNVLFESPTPGSVLLSSTQAGGTNFGAPFPLVTSDLTAFILSSQTNSPAVLSNLFPGLIITSSSNFFTVVQTPILVIETKSIVGAPAGSQELVVVTNGVTFTLVTNYVDTFANVVTNTFHPTSSTKIVTVQVEQLNGAPGGTLTTKTKTKTITLNVPSGDFYINTNACGPNLVLSTLFTNVVATTNLLITASTPAGLFFSQTQVSLATNHILLVEPVVCGAVAGGSTTNSPGLYQGIGKIRFVKASFDGLIGQFFQPITNTYSEVLVVNHQSIHQTFQRIVTTPDFLFTAADLNPSPAADFDGQIAFSRIPINFDESNIGAGLAGPGVINPSSTITYNKAGETLRNVGTASLSQSTAALDTFIWGSFDETTNDPVIYPNGDSIANLANQVLIQITPANSLPDGTHGVAYPAITFTASGGPVSPPFTWSLASGPVVSGGLPPGLTLSSGGTVSGTPTQTGTFDFTVELTDSSSRTVTWNYSITIN